MQHFTIYLFAGHIFLGEILKKENFNLKVSNDIANKIVRLPISITLKKNSLII